MFGQFADPLWAGADPPLGAVPLGAWPELGVEAGGVVVGALWA